MAVILLSVGGVALVLLLVVIVLLILSMIPTKETLRADGDPIVNAEAALRQAERRARLAVDLAEVDPSQVVVGSDLACWFSYPEGASVPEDFVLCGPVVFGDSEPGTSLLPVPVTYESRDGRVWVTVSDVGSVRTVAPKPDHELVRPDGEDVPDDSFDELRLALPNVSEAEPGDMGLIPPEGVMVELAETENGELAGFGYETEVARSGWAGRVRLQDDILEPASIYAAPEGHRWVVFELATDLDFVMAAGSPTGEVGLTVVADEERFSLNDGLDWISVPSYDPVLFAVVVPIDAEDVSLIVDDGVVEQGWSFTKQERSGELPALLERDPETLTAEIDQELTLPYGARDLNPDPGPPPPPGLDVEPLPPLDISEPFGDQELTLKVGEAYLAYGFRLGAPGVFGDSGDAVHKASGSDRALLSLAEVEATWGDWMGPGYVLAPEDMVLTLADGTRMPATRVPGDILSGSDDYDNRVAQAVFYSLVWDVPADIETATVTATFRSANDGGDVFEIYFQDATIEIELDFNASS